MDKGTSKGLSPPASSGNKTRPLTFCLGEPAVPKLYDEDDSDKKLLSKKSTPAIELLYTMVN